MFNFIVNTVLFWAFVIGGCIFMAWLIITGGAGAGELPLSLDTQGRISHAPIFQYTEDGSLKIDKASFDALLRDYPNAKLRVILTPCYYEWKYYDEGGRK